MTGFVVLVVATAVALALCARFGVDRYGTTWAYWFASAAALITFGLGDEGRKWRGEYHAGLDAFTDQPARCFFIGAGLLCGVPRRWVSRFLVPFWVRGVLFNVCVAIASLHLLAALWRGMEPNVKQQILSAEDFRQLTSSSGDTSFDHAFLWFLSRVLGIPLEMETESGAAFLAIGAFLLLVVFPHPVSLSNFIHGHRMGRWALLKLTYLPVLRGGGSAMLASSLGTPDDLARLGLEPARLLFHAETWQDAAAGFFVAAWTKWVPIFLIILGIYIVGRLLWKLFVSLAAKESLTAEIREGGSDNGS